MIYNENDLNIGTVIKIGFNFVYNLVFHTSCTLQIKFYTEFFAKTLYAVFNQWYYV